MNWINTFIGVAKCNGPTPHNTAETHLIKHFASMILTIYPSVINTYHVLLCTQSAIPHRDSIIPIQVSTTPSQPRASQPEPRGKPYHTSPNNLPLPTTLPQNRKQKRQRIRNRNRQLNSTRTNPSPKSAQFLLEFNNPPLPPSHRKKKKKKTSKPTSLPQNQEEPDTPRTLIPNGSAYRQSFKSHHAARTARANEERKPDAAGLLSLRGCGDERRGG